MHQYVTDRSGDHCVFNLDIPNCEQADMCELRGIAYQSFSENMFT